MTQTDTRLPAIAAGPHKGRSAILLGGVVLLLAGVIASWHLSTWSVKLRYPGELSYIEGMRLAEMLHLRQGVRIYAPPSQDRFDAAIYGPLYYLLGARLIDPQNPAFFPLRLISMIATLGCAAGCALLAYWLSGSSFAALLAPLILFAYRFVSDYALSSRSDMVALLIFLSAFLVAYRFQVSSRILLAAPLMLAGFFYKQQFIAGPLAVLLFLLLAKRYRLAFLFAGTLLIGGVSMLLLFQFVIFREQAFLSHFIVYNLIPFSWFSFGAGVGFFLLLLSIPLLVGLEFLRLHPNKLLRIYLILTAFLSLAMVSKQGSDANYFLECVLVLAPLFAALIAKRLAEPARGMELTVLLGVALLFGQQGSPRTVPQSEDFARDQAIQEFLRQQFKPRAAALGFYTGDLLRAGLETPIPDLYQFVQLTRKGVLREQSLLSQIRAGRFAVIVVTFDLRAGEIAEGGISYYLTEPLRRAILQNYELSATLDLPRPELFDETSHCYFWVPRPPQGELLKSAPR
jgi:hypothetical protein